MAVIPPVAASPAPLQTSTGQTAPAPQAPLASTPQAVAAVQTAMSEQKAFLFAVLQQALGAAAPRQNGLAPLMADAEAMLARNGASLPQSVKVALQDVLSTRLGGIDAARLQQAVKQSGVFLESGLAKGQPVQGDLKAALLGLRHALQTWLAPQGGDAAARPAPASGHAPAVTAPQPGAQSPIVQQAAQPGASLPQATPAASSIPQQSVPASPSTPMRDAALRLLAETDAVLSRPVLQPAAAADTPLKANLEAMLARNDAPLPPAVRAAIQVVLGQRPAPPPGGDAVKLQATLQAGLFPQTAPAGFIPTGDLKSALLDLRQALQNWLAPKADPALLPQTLPPAHAPAPPHRNGPTVPQPPVLPGALDGLPLRDAGLRLLGETDAALSRHTMLQIASLPEEVLSGRASDTTQRLVFDIPLNLPQGTAIMQLRIERDGKRGGKDAKKPVWQAMFSIDVEPIGPVHARIAMIGEQANVSLFAERGDSAKALREAMPLLEAGLNEAAIAPGEILCATGAPASPVTAPGLFVDRAS